MLPGELLQEAVAAEQDYLDCAARHGALIDWSKEAIKTLEELRKKN